MKKRFQYGDIVEFRPVSGGKTSARAGALAQVIGYSTHADDRRKEWVSVIWVKGQRGQSDGNYSPEDFALLVRPKI